MMGAKKNQVLLLVSVVSLAAVAAVIIDSKPFIRLIPADVLRDHRQHCFASTLCQLFKPNQTWSLDPFCGRARCVALKDKSGKIRLGEEVTDCGPVIDDEKSPGCTKLVNEFDEKADFPNCCPVHDCEDENAVVYVKTARFNEKGEDISRRKPKGQ